MLNEIEEQAIELYFATTCSGMGYLSLAQCFEIIINNRHKANETMEIIYEQVA